MPLFSANLGFLWTELSLTDAIAKAKMAGFDAVEAHWPYDYEPNDIKAALQEAELSMLCINTRLGINGTIDFGVMAKPGREHEARSYVDEAVEYGAAIGCPNIHAVAGKTDWSDKAETTYRANLRYACERAAEHGMGIMIEPINQRDVPDYHLRTVEQGVETIKAVGKSNLKIMFDCYHIQISQGDLLVRLKQHLSIIGHIQIAAVPNREEPDVGEINYPFLLAEIDRLGWQGYVGTEYKPLTTTDEGLGWLQRYQD